MLPAICQLGEVVVGILNQYLRSSQVEPKTFTPVGTHPNDGVKEEWRFSTFVDTRNANSRSYTSLARFLTSAGRAGL